MNIAKYTGYFHDGYLDNITHSCDAIEFLLESSSISPQDIKEGVNLSKSNTFYGTLKISKIKKVIFDDKEFKSTLHMEYKYGEILDLEIGKNRVFLLIEWKDPTIKLPRIEVSKIEIEADEITWQNMVKPEHKQKN